MTNSVQSAQTLSDVKRLAPCLQRTGIWVVIVACNRPTELARLFQAISAQSVPVDQTVVIDNGDSERVEQEARNVGANYHRSYRNIGGAGGFALGILLALSGGAETLWLWDDDGWPEDGECLSRLLAYSTRHGAAITSPLVVSAEDPTRTAFGFRGGSRSSFSRADIAGREVIPGIAHLFNGALIPASCFDRFGLPDTRLFIRGDEEDFFFRVIDGGGHVATVTAAVARHPSGEADAHDLLGGRLFVIHPANSARRRIMFRNKGYLFVRHRRWGMLALNVVRYGVFYLLRRRPDLAAYREWLCLTVQGMRERLGPP